MSAAESIETTHVRHVRLLLAQILRDHRKIFLQKVAVEWMHQARRLLPLRIFSLRFDFVTVRVRQALLLRKLLADGLVGPLGHHSEGASVTFLRHFFGE